MHFDINPFMCSCEGEGSLHWFKILHYYCSFSKWCHSVAIIAMKGVIDCPGGGGGVFFLCGSNGGQNEDKLASKHWKCANIFYLWASSLGCFINGTYTVIVNWKYNLKIYKRSILGVQIWATQGETVAVHYSPMKSRKWLAWDVFNYNTFATHVGLVYVTSLTHIAWHKMAALTVTHKIKTSPVLTFKYWNLTTGPEIKWKTFI